MFFRPCDAEDLPRVAEVEANSYPPDEAASPEALAFRQASAGDFFLVGLQSGTAPDGGDEMIGYVCATLTSAATLTHDSMVGLPVATSSTT